MGSIADVRAEYLAQQKEEKRERGGVGFTSWDAVRWVARQAASNVFGGEEKGGEVVAPKRVDEVASPLTDNPIFGRHGVAATDASSSTAGGGGGSLLNTLLAPAPTSGAQNTLFLR